MENTNNSVPLENNSKNVVVMRNEKGQLLPGYTPNPYGKPKGARHMATLLKEAIEKISEGDEEPADVLIVKKVLQMAKRGDMRAISHIWNRIDGNAPQTIVVEDGSMGLTIEQRNKLNSILQQSI